MPDRPRDTRGARVDVAPIGDAPSGGAAALTRASTIFFLASLAIAVAILFVQAARPYAWWPNVSDDFFYYLLLARETIHHGVVSVDGVRPTNGFHPLYFLILRSLYPHVSESALPGVALALLAACHALTCVIVWATLRRIAGGAIAGAVAGLYAANPFVLRILFAAVESPLLALALSACLWLRVRWLESGSPRHRWLMLLVLAIAVASRTDAIFFALALALAPVLARWRERAGALRAVDWTPLAAGALPVLVFGLWSLRATGEFFQVSGRAISFWQSINDWRVIHEALARLGALSVPATAVVYALEVVIQYVGWVLRGPFELVRYHPLGMILVGAGVVAHLAGREEGERASGSDEPVARRLERELALYLVLMWGAYALLFRHCQVWYWHGSVLVAAVLIAIRLVPLGRLARSTIAARVTAHAPRLAGALVLVAAVGFSAVALAGFFPHDSARRAATIETGDSVPDPLALVPDGATLAAFDTGQLGWEQPRLQIVNLDGLVNNTAYRALRARAIGDYMRDQQIEWLYVNDVVVRRFRPFGLDAWLAGARPIARSAGGVVLYRRPVR